MTRNRPNRPMTSQEVESEILRLIDALETVNDEYEELARDAAEKEANYKTEWAKEYIKQDKGSIKDREAWTDYKMENACYEHKVAEALVKAKQQRLNSIRTQLDALRTLAANARTVSQ